MGSAVFALVVLALSLLVLGMRRLLLSQRPCVVTVNSKTEVPALTFQKLLPALNDGGIPVPSTCGGRGTCGLCRVTIVSGGEDATPTELGRINNADIHAGVRLACQVVVRGNMAVRVPEELFGIETYSCKVRSNRLVAPFMAELVLELPPGATFQPRAGCFVQLTAPPYRLQFRELPIPAVYLGTWERYGLRELSVESKAPVTRAYSLANRPSDTGLAVLNIRLALPPPGMDVPPGVVSSYLFGIEPGMALELSGPFGSFGAQQSEREMFFIGGGAGMAPLRAIIFDQLERVKTKRRLSFWYGARTRADVFYSQEFDRLQQEHDNFSWTVALSEPAADDAWDGPTGFIHEVVRQHLKNHPAPEECEYYLCGPPLMTQAVFSMLDEFGVDRENVFNDDFGV